MTATRKLLLSSAAALAAGGLIVAGGGIAAAADPTPPPASTEASTESSAETDGALAESAATDAATTADGDGTAAVSETAPATRPVEDRTKAASYSKLSVSPRGPYAGGETVKITGSGFAANEQVVLSVCIGGKTLAGPQDCAPLNGSGSAVGAANGSGVASLSIKVIKGKLGAQSDPAHVCGSGSDESCVFSLTNFAGGGPTAVPITYKAAGAAQDTAADDADDAGESGGSNESTSAVAADGTGGPQLAATGGTAMNSAAIASALLVLGAFLVLVTRREQLEG